MLRAQNIGSSEVAGLFALQADHSDCEFTLHQVKSGIIPPPPVDSSPGTRIWYGSRMEPIIGEMAAELYGWKIEAPGPFCTDDVVSGMSASLDGIILSPGEEELRLGFSGPGLLEIKRSEWAAHNRAYTNNEPPYQIVLQGHHGMACANLTWGVVVVLVGELGLMKYPYARRENTVSIIRDRVTEFWRDVHDRVSPNPDGTASSAYALKAMFPALVGEPLLDLLDNDEADVAAAALLLTRANAKASDMAVADSLARIKYQLKGAVEAETANHWITARTTKNGAVTVRVVEKVPT